MSTFVGGKLKLKGGVDPTQLKGGVKKKKKKSKAKAEDEHALSVVPAGGGQEEGGDGGDGGDQQQQQAGDADQAGGSGGGLPPGVVKSTGEGLVLDPTAVADRRTEAEKKAEAHFLKYEEQRAKKLAAKSHKERIKELNEKLANLTEHHDLFRISYTA